MVRIIYRRIIVFCLKKKTKQIRSHLEQPWLWLGVFKTNYRRKPGWQHEGSTKQTWTHEKTMLTQKPSYQRPWREQHVFPTCISASGLETPSKRNWNCFL